MIQRQKKVNNKTVECTVEELKEKVKILVRHAYAITTNEQDDSTQPLITGKKVKHGFQNEDGTLSWYEGTVISQVIGVYLA